MAVPPIPHSETGSRQDTQDQKGAGTKRRMQQLFWAVVVIALLMVISLPTVLLVFFGMLPTIVAWLIDRTEQKYATFCVGGVNFAGLFPFLSDIWFRNHSVDTATTILTNVFDLTIIYGSAAFGWLLYLQVPPVVTTVLQVMSQRRVAMLRESQQQIIEEWGEGVTTLVDQQAPAELPAAPSPAEDEQAAA